MRAGASASARARTLAALLVAVAPALAAPAGGAAGEASPTPFRSAEGAFTARFPEAPRYEEKREITLLGPLLTRSWEVERGALRLRVERHDVPTLAVSLLGAEGLLSRAARGLLDDLAARHALAEPAALRGHPGRHLRYEPGERPGETEDAWLYLLGRRLYVVFARSRDAETRSAAETFVASVDLLE